MNNVYFEELEEYSRLIKRDRAKERMQEVEIAGAATGNKEYITALLRHYKTQYLEASHREPPQETLDKSAFDRLKGKMRVYEGGKNKR